MNANADDATHVDTEAPAPGAEGDNSAADAPAKPARRKRAVKPAAAEAGAGAADAPQEAAPATDEPPAAAKPARKRRAPKAATESEPEAPPAEAAATPPADVPAIATVHVDPRPESQPLSPVAAAAAEVVAPAGSEPAAQPADGSAPASAEGEGGPRSERSRRRSRRDRRRGRGDEAAPIDASQAVAADDGDDDDEDGAEAPPPVENLPPTDPGDVFAHVLSGQFDTEGEPPAEEPQQQHKRVLRPEPDAPKLHKVLAQAGVGSRRDMEQLILDGKVAVNGQPAHIGQRISFGDRIQVEGRPVKVRIVPPPPRIIAYHKPVGEVVTHDDPQHRPTVFRRLPRLQQGKWQSVGRLDLNTEGLLLFTNSGELANQLMHPRFGVEREYAVRVLGTLDEDLKAELLEGVEIEGQMASFRSIEDGGGEGANHWYRVVITEGRNREVRKLFEEVGLTVSRLIRIRYGTVVLPRGLKRGVWVDLGDEDVRAIRKLASGGEGQAREERGGRGGRNKNRNDRGPRNDRNDRNDRNPPRNGPPRGNRPSDVVRADVPRDRDDRDVDTDEDIDHSQIPNPLEQTFDKRFVQNPRSAVGGRGFRSGGGGFGSGGSAPGGPKKGSGPREPDPLQTSVGYIGADAFHRKGNRGGGRGGGGGGGNRGGGGGFGGGGGGGGRRGR